MTPRLSDFFELSETAAATHSWTLASSSPGTAEDTLAEALADRIVAHQCRQCPQFYEAWRASVKGVASLSARARMALEQGFIGPIFGLPDGARSVPPDHLEGAVGQLLWYFLELEALTAHIVRAEPPGFRVTDAGGDGLVIHRVDDQYLMFRLWEIKKHTGSNAATGVNATVNAACGQITRRGIEYLARYSAIGQEMADPELAAFYGQLMDLWYEASKEAAAGVAVVTSLSHVPDPCFADLEHSFPRFRDPVRLRGMLAAVDDFGAFAARVQEHVWKGL